MALESGTYISDLVSTNPVSTDGLTQADDHLRLIKSTVKATFPNISGAVTATHTELNLLDGVTATTAELNYVDGVTSNIQTQLDAKQPLDAGLTAYAALVTAANKGLYFTGSDTPATFDLSAFARTLLDDADAATARSTLGLGSLSTLSAVGTAQITDGNVTTVKLADNSVTGAKIALGSDAQGDIMYYNGTDWARLAAGTSGQYLKTNGAGAAPAWESPSAGGMTLLGTLTTTSGTSQSLTSLTLTSYKFLKLVVRGISHDSGTARSFTLNGTAFSSAVANGTTIHGMIDVELSSGYAVAMVSDGTGAASSYRIDTYSLTTASTTVTVALSGSGNLDLGSITVYGVK